MACEFDNLQVRDDELKELEELERHAVLPPAAGVEHERHRKINILPRGGVHHQDLISPVKPPPLPPRAHS